MYKNGPCFHRNVLSRCLRPGVHEVTTLDRAPARLSALPNLFFSFMKTKSADNKKFCKLSEYLHFHSKNESFVNRDVIFKPSNWLFQHY